MARSVRIDPENGIHHVFTRGTKRWAIFLDDADRNRFMGVLSRVCDRHNVKVMAFCLMDNHFHLVVQCPGGGLSAALRDLKSLYARYFNNRHGSSGPIYENRFGSKLVATHRQLRQVVRYVHRNPYAIDSCLDLSSYRWCSHGMYLSLVPTPVWMRIDEARALFPNYRSAIEQPVDSDNVQNRTTAESPQPAAAPITTALSLTDVLVAVARAADSPLSEVHPRYRNGLAGMAAVLAAEAGYSYQEMCEPLGYRTPSAVASAALRARQQARPQFATALAAARRRLWPHAA